MSDGEKLISTLLAGILLAVIGLAVLMTAIGWQVCETVEQEIRQAVPFKKGNQ